MLATGVIQHRLVETRLLMASPSDHRPVRNSPQQEPHRLGSLHPTIVVGVDHLHWDYPSQSRQISNQRLKMHLEQ